MRDISDSKNPPAVSIVLPTYNRSDFLPRAIASIQGQTFQNWELIVIDDGSTDATQRLMQELAAGIEQPVISIHQENQGPYSARNAGLDRATGRYIAFFDSDDLWLSHHLDDCVTALERNSEVDWVYGACRIVEQGAGNVLAENTFYVGRAPRPFLKLHARRSGQLRIIQDSDALQCMILHGTYSGLQNSVVRRELFENEQFESSSGNEAEDQLFAIRSLARGRTLAYFDNVHVVYHVHSGNSSAAGDSVDFERQSRVLRLLAEGYERTLNGHAWRAPERRALRKRLKQEYFWKLGYATLWKHGHRREAIEVFRRGLRFWPWDWRCWKTYVIAVLRCNQLRKPFPATD